MTNEEIEAYLRKHTLNGAMRELRDACKHLKDVVIAEIISVIVAIRTVL